LRDRHIVHLVPLVGSQDRQSSVPGGNRRIRCHMTCDTGQRDEVCCPTRC
jgi:hypothetical protein